MVRAETVVRNTTWGELQLGQTATLERTCSTQDLILFAHVSGNVNPVTLPSEQGDTQATLAPSMWVGSLVSAVLGNILPGPGTLYRSQDLRFLKRARVGDKVKVSVSCREKRERPVAVFDTKIVDAAGEPLCEGAAEIEVPTKKLAIQARDLPALIVDSVDHFAALIAR